MSQTKGAKIVNSTTTNSLNLSSNQNETSASSNGLNGTNNRMANGASSTNNGNQLTDSTMFNASVQKIKVEHYAPLTPSQANPHTNRHTNATTQQTLINLNASNLINSHLQSTTKSIINQTCSNGQLNRAQLNNQQQQQQQQQLANQLNQQLNQQQLNNNQQNHSNKPQNGHPNVAAGQPNGQQRTSENKTVNQSNQVTNYDQINSLPDSPETNGQNSTIAIYDQEIDEFLQQQQMNATANGQSLDENLIESTFIDGKRLLSFLIFQSFFQL